MLIPRILILLIKIMNNSKEKTRVANGKPAKLSNNSMAARYEAGSIELDSQTGHRLGDQAFADMTDKENDEVSVF